MNKFLSFIKLYIRRNSDFCFRLVLLYCFIWACVLILYFVYKVF